MNNPINISRPATNVIAYTYNAELLCPCCLIEAAPVEIETDDIHLMLDAWAEDAFGSADDPRRFDESSYDSGMFPKVVFSTMAEDDECASCGEAL